MPPAKNSPDPRLHWNQDVFESICSPPTHSNFTQSIPTGSLLFDMINRSWTPTGIFAFAETVMFQSLDAGRFIRSISLPSIFPERISTEAGICEVALMRSFFKVVFPKSTALYRIQESFRLKVVFQPFILDVVSIKSTTASLLISLYRSIWISFVAFVKPTPRNVGLTFLIVPSLLKNKLSALIERFLSKFGERSIWW